MSTLYKFPPQAAYGATVPKNLIYEKTKAAGVVRERFVREVEKIVWSFKLAEKTVGLAETSSLHEIQVFTLHLKSNDLSEQVLATIDRAIPSPIWFELSYAGKVRNVAAFKRPNEAAPQKWVISDYFWGEWVSDEVTRKELPVSLHLGNLYRNLLVSLLPVAVRPQETLPQWVQRAETLKKKETEIDRLEARLHREKQFNRKVELHSTLKKLQEEVLDLKSG